MRISLRNGSLLLVALAVGCRQPRQPLKNGFLTPEIEQQRPASAVLPAEFSMPARDVMDSTNPPKVMLADSEPPRPAMRHRARAMPHTADATQQETANLQPEVSAMGQLSTGDENAIVPDRINASIAATENALNQIHRELTRQQQHTVAQIREFLKEARQALASGDTDGAAMLAGKANILLRELRP